MHTGASGVSYFFFKFYVGEQKERSVARKQQQRRTTENNNNGVSTGGGVWQDTVRLWFIGLKLGSVGGWSGVSGCGQPKKLGKGDLLDRFVHLDPQTQKL